MSSQSSHHPQEVLLAQFSLYVHKGGLKPDSFYFHHQLFYFTVKNVHLYDACLSALLPSCLPVCLPLCRWTNIETSTHRSGWVHNEATSRQKEARSRDYALLLFRMTPRVLDSAQYHRQNCTLHAFEQLRARYMHNHDDKYPARKRFEPGTSWLQAPVDMSEPSGPAGCRMRSIPGYTGSKSNAGRWWPNIKPNLVPPPVFAGISI